MDVSVVRRAALVFGWLALGQTAGLAGAEDASQAGELPRSRARMYALPSRQVWESALATLKELHLAVAEIDRSAQAAVTVMADFDRGQMPVPTLPVRYLARKVQFYVFVSPFTEPARVYLGSILEAENHVEPELSGYIYGVPALEDWLFGRLEAALGQTGQAMPATSRGRDALALSLGGPAPASGCSGPRPPGARIKEPQPIKVTRVQPVYPAKEGHQAGVVKVQANLLEDGAIVEARALENTGPSMEYAQAAVGAVRLWRYRPTQLGECPVATIMTVTVNFRHR
jgi:hypothetical protein